MANFKLKESADKVSVGTALAGANIIPQTGFIMPFAGPTPLTTATGTSGTNTIVVASATGAFVGQGIYGTGLNSPATGLNYITAVSGTTLTVAYPLTSTISASNVRFCPAGWLLCDGNNGTVDLTGYFVIGATSAANIAGTVGADNHSHTYAFSNLTYSLETNTHEAPAFYTGLKISPTETNHSHGIDIVIDTASFSGANFINWANGSNTTRTFVSHDHTGTYVTNVAVEAPAGHIHGNTAALSYNTAGTLNHTVTETAHRHNTISNPSGTAPTAATTAGNILMNYIVKV
jgi:hypothetical protein